MMQDYFVLGKYYPSRKCKPKLKARIWSFEKDTELFIDRPQFL